MCYKQFIYYKSKDLHSQYLLFFEGTEYQNLLWVHYILFITCLILKRIEMSGPHMLVSFKYEFQSKKSFWNFAWVLFL